MKGRGLFVASISLAAAAIVSGVGAADDEVTAVQQAIRNSYAAYSGFDEQKYRGTTTEDYLLLEHGELIDRDGDVASMAKPGIGFRRTDEFDFRSVKVDGTFAYAVYILTSEIFDDIKGSRHREWLESAILRRDKGAWRLALLHSTRISELTGAKGMLSFAARYTAAWCSQDPARVATFYADNGSLKINDGTPSVGRAAITEAALAFMRDFPDLIVEMDGLERKGIGYIYRWTLTGTNAGPGGMSKKVKISGYEEWTIDAAGLIARSLGHFDAADYNRQLGKETGG